MGRGRAKAKQQKVARELKYNAHFTDLDALQRELGVADSVNGVNGAHAPAQDSDEDEYDDWTGTER
ncbi:DUF3073 domain-containing protein [uncultured Jatrophihabitans sp.]|uniref:DUF3073 domain-containing protein n=1 Tax=uncultured Jatrophihabitans sp. TaxID=1610747 RepID=UPI0035CB39E9